MRLSQVSSLHEFLELLELIDESIKTVIEEYREEELIRVFNRGDLIEESEGAAMEKEMAEAFGGGGEEGGGDVNGEGRVGGPRRACEGSEDRREGFPLALWEDLMGIEVDVRELEVD